MLEVRGKPSQNYGCHTIILGAPHKRTHPALTPASKAGTWFTYPRGMEGWADLGALTSPRLGVEPATAWSKVWRPNCRCVRPYDDSKTANTIAASIVHSKLDYCNFLYCKSQINRLQPIQNSLARTVVKAPKFSHITPILRSLHSGVAPRFEDGGILTSPSPTFCILGSHETALCTVFSTQQHIMPSTLLSPVRLSHGWISENGWISSSIALNSKLDYLVSNPQGVSNDGHGWCWAKGTVTSYVND